MKRRNNIIYTMVTLALLIAIIFVLDLTVGAVSFGGFTITLVGIPVAIASCVFGPGTGALMGFFWGLTSIIKAATGMDAMGVELLSINVFGTIFTCFVPRMLVGLLAGLIYKGLRHFDKKGYVSALIASASTALLNTVLFLGCVEMFFWNSDYINSFKDVFTDNAFYFIFLCAGWSGLIEVAMNCVVGSSCTFGIEKAARVLNVEPIFKNLFKKKKKEIEQTEVKEN